MAHVRYPAIVDMETEVFSALKNAEVLKKLEEIIPEVVQGRFPHCGAMLWKLLDAGLNRPSPPTGNVQIQPHPFPERGNLVHTWVPTRGRGRPQSHGNLFSLQGT